VAGPLVVETGRAVRAGADRVLGINVNYLRDADGNRTGGARPLEAALGAMGVRWLRYPGGEKSDFVSWTGGRPRPLGNYVPLASTGSRAFRLLEFDRFVALARAVGARPYVVVGCDSPRRTGRTQEVMLREAVALVRYANITRGHGVAHWEIGNENWNNRTSSPGAMAATVARFAAAMKAVDPAIRVGASGYGTAWWRRFLPTAAPHLDFLSVSLYPVWGWSGYKRWLGRHTAALDAPVAGALDAIAALPDAADRARLRVVVAETNAINWHRRGWDSDNTLGHALVTFETFGRLLQHPRVGAAMLWGTRWMDDREAASSVYYALDARNHLLPAGRALALWGEFLHTDFLRVHGGGRTLAAFASASRDRSMLTVWVLNRGLEPAGRVRLELRGPGTWRCVASRRFGGTVPGDRAPAWIRIPPIGDSRTLSLPPVSVTVLRFVR
jgi:alpha-L-arabinofuranosidase